MASASLPAPLSGKQPFNNCQRNALNDCSTSAWCLRRIVDYPHLHPYMLDLYQQPGIAGTVNLDHIKRHYYYTHADINPTRIVPVGPALDLTLAHGRERL